MFLITVGIFNIIFGLMYNPTAMDDAPNNASIFIMIGSTMIWMGVELLFLEHKT